MSEYHDIEDFFAAPPTVGQKAWGMVNDFNHILRTFSRKKTPCPNLGKLAAVGPNSTIKQIVEIADEIGVSIKLIESR